MYLHNGMLFNHKKKEILPFVTTWMDRERERERRTHRKMEIGNRLVVARGWDLWGVSGEMGKGGLKVQISTY